ncbi:hypothetical protein, partial [Streptomyces anthocyanicus]|uniref:hypothetical protein n=1 Tax=Streptomyces anthocyanicus TaxID=68174 RepID=UPI00364F857D
MNPKATTRRAKATSASAETNSPTADPTETGSPAVTPLLLHDLEPIANRLAALLGPPWTINDLTTTPDRLCLRGPDDRELGLAIIIAGAVIQMW